jgi:hypothetical protein
MVPDLRALTTNETRDALRQSVGWITSAYNDCGLGDHVSATYTYEGVSTFESDVTNSRGKPPAAMVPPTAVTTRV